MKIIPKNADETWGAQVKLKDLITNKYKKKHSIANYGREKKTETKLTGADEETGHI